MNNKPPIYILSPISKHIPDYLSTRVEKKNDAEKQWRKESDIMLAAFQKAAEQVLEPQRAIEYKLSGERLKHSFVLHEAYKMKSMLCYMQCFDTTFLIFVPAFGIGSYTYHKMYMAVYI